MAAHLRDDDVARLRALSRPGLRIMPRCPATAARSYRVAGPGLVLAFTNRLFVHGLLRDRHGSARPLCCAA